MAKKKKKLHQRMWFWILLSLLLVGAWRSFMSTPTEPPADREYTAVTVDQLYEELDKNPLRAKDTYTDMYVALTGWMRVIDSDGESVSLYPLEYETLDGIICKLTNDEQREKIKEYSEGDTVTVKGQITEVDGVFRYKVVVDSIE
jgi:hypothetical protein